MAYQNEKDNLWAVIRILGLVIVVLVLLSAYIVFTFKDVGKVNWVDIPARSIGGQVERVVPGVMQKTTVYDFTERTFQSLQRWRYDGSKEYIENIKKYKDVLTPDYIAFLKRDEKRRMGDDVSSELRDRTRMMLPLLTSWDEDRVKVVATKNGKPSAWVVLLDMELLEYHKGQEFKHLYIRYPIRVVLTDADRVGNPWFLALDGYADDPKRISMELDRKKGETSEAK